MFAILLEDAAALVGLGIALLGISLSIVLDAPAFDGVASVCIGGVLILTATILSRETLSLLTGESASREVLASARSLLQADTRVNAVTELLSLHLGPRSILLAISIDFRDELTSSAIEIAARDLERGLKRAHPAISRIYLRPVEPGESRG